MTIIYHLSLLLNYCITGRNLFHLGFDSQNPTSCRPGPKYGIFSQHLILKHPPGWSLIISHEPRNTIGISSGQDILRTYLHRYIINWAK